MTDAVNVLNQAYLMATDGDLAAATPQVSQICQNMAQCFVQQKRYDDAKDMYSRALAIGSRLFGPNHASHALNHLGIARCLKKEGKLPEAIKSYTTCYELWTSKEPEECVREMPEVPNKECLAKLQKQCHDELAELVLFLEELKRRQQGGAEGGGGDGGYPSGGASGPTAAAVAGE